MNSLKLNILLIAAIALASSCSVYRTGQTPDDVYYSPGREASAASYVQVDNRSSNRYNAYDDYLPSEDRYLRMMVRNRTRWSVFNDYDYFSPWAYSPYNAFGYSPYYSPFYSPFSSPYSHMGMGLGMGYINPYGLGYNGFYNSYWSWNSFYNPYYPSGVVYNPKTNPAGYTMLRSFNLNSYTNRTYNNNVNAGKTYYRGLNVPKNNTAPNATLGSSVRRIFSGETPRTNQGSGRSSYYSQPNERPVRTYRPSTYNNNNNNSYNNTRSNSSGVSGGNSGSYNSGGSAPGSRPSRR